MRQQGNYWGGQDGRGTYSVVKDNTMEQAHEEEYAGHPILRLFTRPGEMENGQHTRMSKQDIGHMNGAEGKKLTHKALRVALALHARHNFHLAVATDGAKKGERVTGWSHRAWQGPESAKILRDKRKKATALHER
eukprot:263641-Pleurochrysis_carterae.AAC.2